MTLFLLLSVLDFALAGVNFYVYKLTGRKLSLVLGIIMSGFGLYNIAVLTV